VAAFGAATDFSDLAAVPAKDDRLVALFDGL
jgi:hypothetical protein